MILLDSIVQPTLSFVSPIITTSVFRGLIGLMDSKVNRFSLMALQAFFKMNHPRFFQDFFYQQYDDNMFWGEICLHHVGWKSCNIIQYAQGTLPDAPGRVPHPLPPPFAACPSIEAISQKCFRAQKSAELWPVASFEMQEKEGNKVDPNCEKSMPHRVVILLGVSLKEEICHASTLEMPKLTCLQWTLQKKNNFHQPQTTKRKLHVSFNFVLGFCFASASSSTSGDFIRWCQGHRKSDFIQKTDPKGIVIWVTCFIPNNTHKSSGTLPKLYLQAMCLGGVLVVENSPRSSSKIIQKSAEGCTGWKLVSD